MNYKSTDNMSNGNTGLNNYTAPVSAAVDITAKMKAIAGSTDQGGGIGWRAKNSKNYYVVRNKTLGDNYRSTLLRMETDQNSEAQISRILLDGTHSA